MVATLQRGTLQTFSAPRRPEAAEEYEDAVLPAAPEPQERALPLQVAVADGATASSFSGLWARLLVQGFADGVVALGDPLPGVAQLSARWRQETRDLALTWFAAEKRKSGAHAALVGLTVQPGGRWEALAVGDCCLFLVRDDRLCEAFPVARAEDLSSAPALLATDPDANAALGDWVRACEGRWQAGDRFYLMSDALAAWFLATSERAQAPWRRLERLSRAPGSASFAALVDDLRRSRLLRVDDVTLALLTL